MHPSIIKVVDSRRGCGTRKVGGLYLRDDGPAMSCSRLPIKLDRCPCCGHGVPYSRRAQWLDGDAFLASNAPQCGDELCLGCPLKEPTNIGSVLLQWIGRKFYTVSDFNTESEKINPETGLKIGISRRISTLPHGFKIGETFVFLAHLDAIENPDGTHTPAVFRVFRPSRVEVICDGTEDDATIDKYLQRGLTPVFIDRVTA